MQNVNDTTDCSSAGRDIDIRNRSLLNQHIQRIFLNFDVRLQDIAEAPAVLELENLMEVGPAQIGVDQKDTAFRFSQRGRQVRSGRALAVLRIAARQDHHLRRSPISVCEKERRGRRPEALGKQRRGFFRCE